jgi:hypothetical protein
MWKKNSKVNLRKTGEHPQVLRTVNCYFHKVHRDIKNRILTSKVLKMNILKIQSIDLERGLHLPKMVQ